MQIFSRREPLWLEWTKPWLGSVRKTESFKTEFLDPSAYPHSLQQLSIESLIEKASGNKPKQAPAIVTFLFCACFGLALIVGLDSIALAIKGINAESPEFVTYFDEYSNPLSFSVFLSLISVFALAYAALEYVNKRESVHDLFRSIHGILDFWPVIPGLGFALETQSIYGFYVPALLPSRSDNTTWQQLKDFVAMAWDHTTSQSPLPWVLTLSLFLITCFIIEKVQDGRLISKTESTLAVTRFTNSVRKHEKRTNDLLAGNYASMTLWKARKYLAKEYPEKQSALSRSRPFRWIFAGVAEIVFFVFYYAYLVEQTTNSSQNLSPIFIFCAGIFFGFLAIWRARMLRFVWAFRKSGEVVTDCFVWISLSLGWWMNSVLTLFAVYFFATTLFNDKIPNLTFETIVIISVMALLTICSLCALFMPASDHYLASKGLARLYLRLIDDNINSMLWHASRIEDFQPHQDAETTISIRILNDGEPITFDGKGTLRSQKRSLGPTALIPRDRAEDATN